MARYRQTEEETLVEETAVDNTEQTESAPDVVPEFVPEDEFAKPTNIDKAALAAHQPEAARPRAVRLRTAPGNPHHHDDGEFPPDTLTPSLPERRQAKDRGPFAGVEPLEANPALLKAVQDPFRERDPNHNKPEMVVVLNSYGDPVLTPA